MFEYTDKSNVAELIEIINFLVEDRVKLHAKIAELSEKLKQYETKNVKKDSTNSGISPSQDPNKAQKKTNSLRTNGQRKVGGKEKHKGKSTTMFPVEKVDEFVDVHPDKCCGCGFDLSNENMVKSMKQQILDIIIKQHIIEKQHHSATCPMCNLKNDTSTNIKNPITYGENLYAYVVYNSVNNNVAYNKLTETINYYTEYDITDTTIMNMVERYCDNDAFVDFTTQNIQILKNTNVVHLDETKIGKINNKRHYLHTFSSELNTFVYLAQNRSLDKLFQLGLLSDNVYQCLVHDCYSTYLSDLLKKYRHQICVQHLVRNIRYFVDVYESTKDSMYEFSIYAESMLNELYDLKHDTEYSKDKVDELKNRWLTLNKNELSKLNKPPKKCENKVYVDYYNIIERFIKLVDSIFLCAYDLDVPYTNNIAEQSFRCAKTKLKVCGCFRSITGADTYAKILSFLSTIKKRDMNPIEQIINIIRGNKIVLV